MNEDFFTFFFMNFERFLLKLKSEDEKDFVNVKKQFSFSFMFISTGKEFCF